MISVRLFLSVFVVFIFSCEPHRSSHDEMVSLLQDLAGKYNKFNNYYAADAQVTYYDSLIQATSSQQEKMIFTYSKARALIALGEEQQAIPLLEEQVEIIERDGIQGMNKLKVLLAMAYLRNGERNNCIANHTGETCIMPIQGTGIHKVIDGSTNAIRLYEQLLHDYPENLEYRWLLNIAYMTLGEYPDQVPKKFLLPGLDNKSAIDVKAFNDFAGPLDLTVNNMAGGAIVDDFDNDGYNDIVTSGWGLDDEMHFFRNNAGGTFTDNSERSHLKSLTGGLNLLQLDFDNDGYKDIFVLRGAWLRGSFCLQPNSLIRNNGDGTFTDVTTTSGLLSFHPTQTATWNDFNNDGWLDVFIGNESWEGNASSGVHPCELYINNKNNTFTNVAKEAGCDVVGFVKGVTSGDYNNDGWKDIFVSTLSGKRYLFKNTAHTGAIPVFQDVTQKAKLSEGNARTFPTWFWDYNNDGWLDILAVDFTFDQPITSYFAAQALGQSIGSSGTPTLYRNNQDGTFSNVSGETGLGTTAFAMGANFGDINNDGYLDFYLGTGNPEIESIVPNKMFLNVQGERFEDITVNARVGHLQKGHAIAFADLDNDGDQDIYSEMGGAYRGDAFHNSLYLNPGQNEVNSWIAIELIGSQANRSAIGSTIRLTFREEGKSRSVYREVNSGGSFGASPLRKEIGIGNATLIDELEIKWHPGKAQVFNNINPNQVIRIQQGSDKIETISLKVLTFRQSTKHQHLHAGSAH